MSFWDGVLRRAYPSIETRVSRDRREEKASYIGRGSSRVHRKDASMILK